MDQSTVTDSAPRNGSAAPALAARVQDAVKVYGSGDTAVRALDGITFDFPPGQFTAVMGPSGSGKSTLMHCMAGLDELTSGSAWLGDTDIASLNERQRTMLRRSHVGFVFQAYNLVPTLTVGENIELPLRLAGQDVETTVFAEVTKRLGIHERLHHLPSEVSGGQQQRTAVARALIARPSVIFADEPTGNLDSRSGNEVLAYLRQAVDDYGQTILMVTHDPSAAAYADRVIYLVDGRVAREQEAPTREGVLDVMKQLGEAG